eukprot:g8699.t3
MCHVLTPTQEFGSMVQSSNGSFGMEARSWNRGYRSYQRDGEEGWRPRWYPPKQIDPDDLPPKAVKAGRELRNLLDFYFEPFNLQHNKFLLDLINRKAAASDQVKSVLSKNILASLSFDPETGEFAQSLEEHFEVIPDHVASKEAYKQQKDIEMLQKMQEEE